MIVPKKYFELQKVVNSCFTAILNKIPDCSEDDYGYIIAQLNLRLAHSLIRLLSIVEEDDEDE